MNAKKNPARRQGSCIYFVDEQPIRRYVAFPIAKILAFQLVILVFFRQGLFPYEELKDIIELGGSVAFLLQHALVVFLELASHVDVKH